MQQSTENLCYKPWRTEHSQRPPSRTDKYPTTDLAKQYKSDLICLEWQDQGQSSPHNRPPAGLGLINTAHYHRAHVLGEWHTSWGLQNKEFTLLAFPGQPICHGAAEMPPGTLDVRPHIGRRKHMLLRFQLRNDPCCRLWHTTWGNLKHLGANPVCTCALHHWIEVEYCIAIAT